MGQLTALIDADVLRYECGSVGQKLNKETGELDILPFDFVKEVFDERIRTIIDGSGASTATLFITADQRTIKIFNRQQGSSISPLTFKPNFREALAEGKVYKGTRNKDKPFHFYNLTAYILSFGMGKVNVSIGLEADDSIGIEHLLRPDETIICTRDKDLRQIPGRHYGWECGKQPEFGPVTYDSLGTIELVRNKSGVKITGGGFKFFCSQVLTGDVVDNIGGAKGIGPVKAYSILSDCATERDCFSAVVSTFKEVGGERWKELLTEQCALIWIVRELNEDGSLKHFNVEEWL